MKNELRIGNLVDLGNRIAKIIEIGHLSCTVVDLEETQDTMEDYERIKPILIDVDWLKKFNGRLEKKNYSLNMGYELFEYVVLGDEIVLYYDKKNGWTLDGNVKRDTHFIKHIHQLQNLYFALTGKELVIKLT